MSKNTHISQLITRLARLSASETWGGDLNPAQVSALSYLSRANRFSRSPSHVAEYLGTTRGTMSQTLKSLVGKGYVAEVSSETDRRSISYDLTPEGVRLAARRGVLDDAVGSVPERERAILHGALSDALRSLVAKNGGRSFGICSTCRHHQRKGRTPYCGLLDLVLKPEEALQICREQTS
ncbi:DNA-binding transcriptional regulator, MarR family [Shimia gijangensis]|uniref:DNA-binding transcriptional regulator, MarR family n=1 Tax=Shimia gijangensis TaxID=1470563 RepID=A0A1M6PDA6_9RHOB|nr:MarR family transcriptional regulator [Shimia gijangensis]SHK05862.1 DNA-binding transcriptional regulator, MarR family [Shimia gijangensis]